MDYPERQEKEKSDFVPPFCICSGGTTVVDGYDNLSWRKALDSLIKLKSTSPQKNFFMVDEAETVVFSLNKDLRNKKV